MAYIDIEIQVYEDEGGKWRWRLKAGNGRITAVSGESFAKKGNAVRAAKRLASIMSITILHVNVEVVE